MEKYYDPEAEYRKLAAVCPGRVHWRLIPTVRKEIPVRNAHQAMGRKVAGQTQDQLLYEEVHYGRH